MENNTSDKFFKGISTQTVVSIANGVMQIVVFAIFSRILSKTDFGYYAALMGVTMIFMGLSDAGIGAAVIQKQSPSDKFCSTAFSISLIVGVFVGCLFFSISPFVSSLIIDDSLITPMRWMTIPLVLYSINCYAVSMLRKQLHFGKIGILKLMSYGISSVVGIIIAIYGGGVYSLIALFVCDSLIYTILLFYNVNIPKIEIGYNEAKSVVSFGGWLTLGVIMSTIANQIDKLVLGKWLSVERLGAYNRPSGFISNIIGQINSVFDSVLFPILSKFQDSKDSFRELLYRSFGLLSTIGTLLAVVLFFNSRIIIIVFFGNQWLNLVDILRIVSLSAIFMLNNTLADCFFRSFNLVRQGFFIRSVGLLLSLLFLYIGVKYDIVGVALSVLLSNFLVVCFKLVFLCHRSGASVAKLMKLSLRALIPSLPIIAIGLFFELLPQSIILVVIESALITMVLLMLLFRYPDFMGQEYKKLIFSKVKCALNNITSPSN